MSDNTNNIDYAEIIDTWDELKDIKDEINDPRFFNRSHGSGGTYSAGCRGPLCRKDEKDRARRKNLRRIHEQGREKSETMGRPRNYDRDYLMDEIIVWHKRIVWEARQARNIRRNQAS